MKPGRTSAKLDWRRQRQGGSALPGDFVRGFIAAGLLSAVQDRHARPAADRRTWRRALQGGASLAAGSAAAQAWQRQDLGRALTAVAVGAASVMAIEHLLKDQTSKESNDGQEKA